jgi:hypothetical protein
LGDTIYFTVEKEDFHRNEPNSDVHASCPVEEWFKPGKRSCNGFEWVFLYRGKKIHIKKGDGVEQNQILRSWILFTQRQEKLSQI